LNLFPKIGINFLNGWIYFTFYLIIFGLILSTCPEKVRERLYDKSLWDKKTKLITAIGKIFSIVNIVMIIFGKLAIDAIEFYIGTILYLFGLSLLVVSIINYRDAPLNQPITKGLYKFSRNPQLISVFITFTGMLLVIGSWINLGFLCITIICTHFSILGEEKSLEKQYGESYLEYKQQVPRYFIFY